MIHFSNQDTLVFQGDSITHGGRVESEWDMNHVIGHGYQSVLASRLGLDNIESHPRIENRGVSGDTVAKMLARWERDTLSLRPTVLSILIGTNDCGVYSNTRIGPTPEQFEKTYRFLLDYTKEYLPDIKLILCEPFCFSSTEGITDSAEIEKILLRRKSVFDCAERVKKIANDYGAVFVPFYEELKKYADCSPKNHIIWDGIHPTYVGHEVLARQWYRIVDESGILK